jgi:hypothetical protein
MSRTYPSAIMSPLLVAYRLTGGGILVALVAVIVVQFATGRINTHGLLRDKSLKGTESLSPARTQLLLSTLTIAVMYAYRVVASAGSGVLPDIPGSALAFVGASHVTYMLGKAITLFSDRGRLSR